MSLLLSLASIDLIQGSQLAARSSVRSLVLSFVLASAASAACVCALAHSLTHSLVSTFFPFAAAKVCRYIHPLTLQKDTHTHWQQHSHSQ